jgi:hypothetical protein
MFLRVVRAAGGKGVKHEYVRVVEAYREEGKTRHRTVLNLGRRDLLAAHLDLNKLTRLLHGEAAADGRIEREDVQAVAAWDWGPMLAAGSPITRLTRALTFAAKLLRRKCKKLIMLAAIIAIGWWAFATDNIILRLEIGAAAIIGISLIARRVEWWLKLPPDSPPAWIERSRSKH